MNFARFRPAVLSATAVLLISGAGSAFASNGTPSIHEVNAAPAVSIVEAAPAVEAVEPAGPDTGNLQEGDQTTSDVTGVAGTETEAAGEAAGAESDGPGGHADDPNDANADHQFEGEE